MHGYSLEQAAEAFSRFYRAHCFVGLFGFWRQHIPRLGVVLRPIYLTPEAVSFVWSLEQEKALQQVQAAVQDTLPLRPYDPADLTALDGP